MTLIKRLEGLSTKDYFTHESRDLIAESVKAHIEQAQRIEELEGFLVKRNNALDKHRKNAEKIIDEMYKLINTQDT